MRFPLWHYLNQPLWDKQNPTVLNPHKYWLHWQALHFDRCLHNDFLEECWQVHYSDFVLEHQDLCSRNALEEDPRWLVERCWDLERQDGLSPHPENQISEREV